MSESNSNQPIKNCKALPYVIAALCILICGVVIVFSIYHSIRCEKAHNLGYLEALEDLDKYFRTDYDGLEESDLPSRDATDRVSIPLDDPTYSEEFFKGRTLWIRGEFKDSEVMNARVRSLIRDRLALAGALRFGEMTKVDVGNRGRQQLVYFPLKRYKRWNPFMQRFATSSFYTVRGRQMVRAVIQRWRDWGIN